MSTVKDPFLNQYLKNIIISVYDNLSLKKHGSVNLQSHYLEVKHNMFYINLFEGTGFLSQAMISHAYIFATRLRRPLLIQTMKSVRLYSLQFTPSDCKDIGIRKVQFVAKTQCLYKWNYLELFYCILYLKIMFLRNIALVFFSQNRVIFFVNC